MHQWPIESDSAAQDIDRQQLAQIKQRFITLNHERYRRTHAALSERQRQFLTLLPLLFHVNHPMLPGYVSHQTPCGLYGYEPDKDTLRHAQIIARSFQFKKDLVSRESDIDAIFVMGSIGTIAHSDSSDLDVWICHQPGLSPHKRAELLTKCQLLSRWAEQHIRLEAHFFPMDALRFQHHESASLSTEGSGSAQHYLLLDEFYRTALWLGGKIPLWWFVPAEQESSYTQYRELLLEKRFIRAGDVIDFGPITHIPASEYLGAGVWQLYKSIAAPYKSLLKLMLLETYSGDTRGTPLALTFKRALYQSAPEADQLDAYVMVYRYIEDNLKARQHAQRLELARRCLYFKVNKALTRAPGQGAASWQRRLLEALTTEWGWTTQLLQHLDSRQYWKAPQVIAERNLLVNELSNGYQLLTALGKSNHADAAISGEELMVLGRRLHAAFERKAGKIDWINPGISRDLHEPDLCFMEEQAGDQQVSGWQLLRGSLSELQQQRKQEPIKRARNLLELVLWCYANGLLTRGTRVDIDSLTLQFNATQKQQLLHSLQQWLPLPLQPINHDQFTRSAQPTRLLLLFNLGLDPHAERRRKGIHLLSGQHDALGYGGQRENLVLSCDIIQFNSWQELVCRHYGEDALVNSLLHYLRLVPPGRPHALPELSIQCLSSNGGAISQRLEELWRDLIACYYSGTRPHNTRYILQMGNEYLLLQFLQQQPQFSRFKSYPALLEKLGSTQANYSPLVIDRNALKDQPLKLFGSVISDASIYVFFQINDQQDRASVSLIDERGSLFVTEMRFYKQQTLLQPLHRFIRTALERLDQDGDLALRTTPRTGSLMAVHFYELLGNCAQQTGRLTPCNVTSEIRQLGYVNIQVIAEPDGQGELSFNVYCNEYEFTAQEYGDRLFPAVARHILGLRQYNERYPCHITDLDLSLCRDLLAPQNGLQLCHYLRIKTALEEKLNQALQQL